MRGREGRDSQLDLIDRRILEILQRDARTSIVEIAKRVNRSDTTVRERVEAMERAGIIRGYQALIDDFTLGYAARAIVQATAPLSQLGDIVQNLRSIPNVVRAVLLAGPNPLVLEVAAEDLSGLQNLIERRLAPLNLTNVTPSVILRSFVERRNVPVRPNPIAAPLEALAAAPAPAINGFD